MGWRLLKEQRRTLSDRGRLVDLHVLTGTVRLRDSPAGPLLLGPRSGVSTLSFPPAGSRARARLRQRTMWTERDSAGGVTGARRTRDGVGGLARAFVSMVSSARVGRRVPFARDAPADEPVATTGPLPWATPLQPRLTILCSTYFASSSASTLCNPAAHFTTREHGLTLARSNLRIAAAAGGCRPRWRTRVGLMRAGRQPAGAVESWAQVDFSEPPASSPR
jgi:hypothetical protein